MKFTIKGKPLAKARPQFSGRHGKFRTYTPQTTATYENLVKLEASKHFPTPLEGPVYVSIVFYLPRPQHLIWKTKPMHAIHSDKRPDIDNLAKSVIDGLNGVAFKDDGQISILHLYKLYHAGHEGPRTEIVVKKME